MPTRDGDKRNRSRVVPNFLDEALDLLLDLLKPGLRVGGLSRVHLVDTNNELLDTEGVSQESVLTSLTVLGDTGLKLTNTSGNNQDSTIGLGSTSDHVLDEITVTGGVGDGDVVPLCKSGGTTTLFLSIKTKRS